MAERAKARLKKTAAKRAGGRGSRGTVATLPKKVGKGHNGPPGMTDDQIRDWQGKLDRAFKKVGEAQEEVRQLNGVYRSLLKSAKKEGFDPTAYVEARNLDREDHGHVQVRYANVGRYLRVRGSNLAVQMSLFQDIDVPPATDEPPAVKGLAAGRRGDVRTANPYKPGSEEWEEFDSSWLTGQREIAEKMGDAAGQA